MKALSVPVFLSVLTLISSYAEAATPNPDSPPLMNDVINGDCGGNFQSVKYFFYESDSILSNVSIQNQNRSCCETQMGWGRIPVAGLVRWGGEGCPGTSTSYAPFAQWIAARPQYVAENRDTTIVGCYDVIVPSVPLDSADWPAGVTHAHYYDWMAPGATSTARSEFILANCMDKWNDYICDGYAQFYGQFCKQIKDRTGRAGFVGMQGTYDAPFNRYLGRDIHLINKRIKENGGTFMRMVEVQGDACCRSPWRHGSALGFLGSFAAQAPDVWVGLQTAAPYTWPMTSWTSPIAGDNPFEETFKRSFACLTTDSARSAALYKYLRGHYLVPGWGHMANSNGTVRRMVQAYAPQYGGAGKIPVDIWNMLQSVAPAHPFGPAVYYSKGIADSYEKEGQSWNFSAILDKYELGIFSSGYFL